MSSEAETFEQWFKLADTNHDGKLDGYEAVTFFKRSNLSQATLKEIWALTAGDSSAMLKPQFFGALRLVSLAQNNGGTFSAHAGRAVLVGTTGPLPLPKLSGLTPEIWNPETAASGATIIQQNQMSSGAHLSPQYTGGSSVQAPSSINQGQSNVMSGGYPQMQQTGSNYTAMTMEDLKEFESLFISLDQDMDGFLTGSDCFDVFMRAGVDRMILKHIWSIVTGDADKLNKEQFVKCLYLIGNAKKGISPPSAIPPGPFPPVSPAAASYLSGIPPNDPYNISSFMPSGHQSMSQKVTYQSPVEPQYTGFRGPEFNEANLNSLDPMQRDRLLREKNQAATSDQRLFNLEHQVDVNKQKKEFYEKSLQEIMLFKRRTDVALMEIEERARQEQQAADEAEQKYEQARLGAENSAQQSNSLVQAIRTARDKKEDFENKINVLNQELKAIEASQPDELRKLELEIQDLQNTVAGIESRNNLYKAQSESFRQYYIFLKNKYEDMELAAAAADAELHSATSDIEKLKTQMESAIVSSSTETVQKLLKEAARVYSNLHTHATKADIEVPFEARMNLYGKDNVWSHDIVQNPIDLNDWHEEGFVLVDAFPDEKDEIQQSFEEALKQSQISKGQMASQAQVESNQTTFPMQFDSNTKPFEFFESSSFEPQTTTTTTSQPVSTTTTMSFNAFEGDAFKPKVMTSPTPIESNLSSLPITQQQTFDKVMDSNNLVSSKMDFSNTGAVEFSSLSVNENKANVFPVTFNDDPAFPNPLTNTNVQSPLNESIFSETSQKNTEIDKNMDFFSSEFTSKFGDDAFGPPPSPPQIQSQLNSQPQPQQWTQDKKDKNEGDLFESNAFS